MSNKIWDDKSTDLSLNGPNLSFSSDITANQTSIAPFGDTGISTMPTSVVFSGVASLSLFLMEVTLMVRLIINGTMQARIKHLESQHNIADKTTNTVNLELWFK